MFYFSLIRYARLIVPSVMTRSVFWSRYFFRVHQIRQEEEKRKALVAGIVNTLCDTHITYLVLLLSVG